jgi:hypothetical protein
MDALFLMLAQGAVGEFSYNTLLRASLRLGFDETNRAVISTVDQVASLIHINGQKLAIWPFGRAKPRDCQCPEPEVRLIVQLTRLRTSGSKGTLKNCWCRFDSEVRSEVAENSSVEMTRKIHVLHV